MHRTFIQAIQRDPRVQEPDWLVSSQGDHVLQLIHLTLRTGAEAFTRED